MANRMGSGRAPAALLLLSNVARAGSQWLLVSVYAILGGPAELGRYSLTLAIAAPVFIASELSLRNVYVTLRFAIPFRTYVTVRVVTAALALVALAGLALAFRGSFVLLMLVGLLKATDSFLDLAHGGWQKRGRLTRIAVSSLLHSAATVLLGAAVYLLTESLELSVAGSLAGSGSIVAAVLFFTYRAESAGAPRLPIRAHEVREILRAGLPAGLAFAAATVMSYLPVYVLGLAAGAEDVGVFALLMYFVTFANLFYNSVQQSTLHTYVARYAEGGSAAVFQYARRIGPPLFLAGVGSAVLVYFFANPFLVSLYGASFAVGPLDVLPIALALVLLPGVYVASPMLMTANRYPVQLRINLASLAIAATAAIALLPGFSVASAGVVVLVGTGCRAVGGLLAALWLLRRRQP